MHGGGLIGKIMAFVTTSPIIQRRYTHMHRGASIIVVDKIAHAFGITYTILIFQVITFSLTPSSP